MAGIRRNAARSIGTGAHLDAMTRLPGGPDFQPRGDEPLFGAVPMEMMDLVLHPAMQMLTVNLASPYVPVALVK